jgi:hypothetical protein
MSEDATLYGKLKPGVKKAWLKALRGGEYKQAQSVLCTGNGAMCCLGVLADVVLDTYWVRSDIEADTGGDWMLLIGKDEYDDEYGEYHTVPYEFRKQLGTITSEAFGHLITLNDDYDYSFDDIADWIEEHL